MNPTLRVVISGAGVGGLCAAAALLKLGIDVDVYEQATELREVGAGVQLSANGTRVLHALGVAKALGARSCVAQGKEIRHWKTGETWKLFDLGPLSIERFGFPYFTVYRPDLLEVLVEAVTSLKPDAIHLGERVAGFEQDGRGVTLLLESGEQVSGSVLIGADGVHSRVRQGLFGADRAQFSGVVAWRAVIPMERLPAHMARMVGSNWVGPGGHIVHYPLRGGTLMNFVGALERADWQVESWSHQGSAAELARDFTGWHEDIQHFIAQIDSPNKWALMTRAPLERWSVGRVTLLGDAAHSMLPFLAQGAVMAIEDGYMLGRCLANFAPEEALIRFERARLARTTRVVEGAAANIWRFHNPQLADAEEGRRFIEREWAGNRISDRYDWLFSYDATTEEL